MDILSHCILLLVFFNLSLTSGEQPSPYRPHSNTASHPSLYLQVLDSQNFRSFTNSSYKHAQILKNSHDQCLVKPFCLYRILILALCPDVELNPGPRAPKFPCKICHKNCSWKTPSVQCDDCDDWYHKECLLMTTEIYNAIGDPNASWYCFTCGLPQFHSSFFTSFGSSFSNSDLDSSEDCSSVHSPKSFDGS